MRNPTLTMVVLIIANFMDLMDTTVVNVALPSIQADLGASSAAVEWVVAAYTLGLAGVLVTGGRLGDLVGIRRVFLVGVAGVTIASLTATMAGTAEILVLARALQGVFAGLMVPQVLACVQALYPPESRAPVFGLVGFITGTASVVGPVLSGGAGRSGRLRDRLAIDLRDQHPRRRRVDHRCHPVGAGASTRDLGPGWICLASCSPPVVCSASSSG